MYDIDHMLNGSNSRQHHQELLDEADKYRLAKQAHEDEKRERSNTLRKMLNIVIPK